MKRIGLICALLATSINGFAQFNDPLIVGERALRMSLSEPVLGTARYSGMAGAMGALGGDGAAIKDNPAGLGVYRKWDIGLTPNVNIDNDANADFNINNFSCVMNFGTKKRSKGYITSSFAIAYNRYANYNRDTYTRGTITRDDKTIPYDNEFIEDDGSGVWNFAYGMNISNKVFAGISLNAATLSYKQSTLYSEFPEGSSYYEDHLLDIDGGGFNFSVGVIGKPNKYLRLGASFTSPTWYNLTECALYPETFDGVTNYEAGYGFEGQKDEAAEYKLQTPLKAEASVGLVLGKRAMIGVDYIFQDYSAIRVKDDRGHQFRDTKYFIDKNYKATHTLKVGAEVQIAKGFAARAGYAFQTSPTQDDCYNRDCTGESLLNHGLYVPYFPENTDSYQSYSIPRQANYITVGAGYHGKHFYADLAYVNKQQKEDFYEWQEGVYEKAIDKNTGEEYDEFKGWVNSPIKEKLITHNIMATIGFKF